MNTFLSFKSELFSSHLFSLLQSAINPCHSDLISKINNQLWVYARRKNPYTLCRRHNEKSEKGNDDIWSINISVLIRSSSVSFFNTFHCSEKKKTKSSLAVVHQLKTTEEIARHTTHKLECNNCCIASPSSRSPVKGRVRSLSSALSFNWFGETWERRKPLQWQSKRDEIKCLRLSGGTM